MPGKFRHWRMIVKVSMTEVEEIVSADGSCRLFTALPAPKMRCGNCLCQLLGTSGILASEVCSYENRETSRLEMFNGISSL